MARKKQPVQLRPVDDDVAPRVSVIRLENSETTGRTNDSEPIRLEPLANKPADQHIELPIKVEGERRTHQPGIESIIEVTPAQPDVLEQNWSQNATRRHSIPWGWITIIALTITGAVLWSLTSIKNSDVQATQIRVATASSIDNEQQQERDANQLIDRIDTALRDFFNTTSVESLIRLVRQPERVAPLMRRYYAGKPVFAGPIKTVKMFRPLTLDNCGNFWMTSVVLANGQSRNVIIEVTKSGEALIDWETLVCYQPMAWDDFVAQRPSGTSLDFRVYVERDHFYSHEFADSDHWTCFRLTAMDSEETLFGYAHAGSDEAQALLKLMDNNGGNKTAIILRLGIPSGLLSRRGVVIEKLLSPRWLYLTPPAAGY